MISTSIKLLPEHLIDQIKAGEVIERPASIVKEIVENSIDAGASKIDIHIKNNGMDLISVIDDGQGMNLDDLPYAFCRHATSKISRFEDLYALNSFGFRGEALASVASVGRVSCVSTPRGDSDKGGKIEIHGGKEVSKTVYKGGDSGTTLYIRDLFFNTPVRMKFIKSATSEKNATKKIIDGFVLSHPEVSFSVKWDEQDKIIFPACDLDKIEERVQKVFFKGKSKDSSRDLLEVEAEYDSYEMKGFVSKFCSKGFSGKKQFLMVNGRMFTDKQLFQAISSSMSKVWIPGETGHYFINLKVPASHIDVNVHPSKTHIKFKNISTVYSLISTAIKTNSDKFISEEGSTGNYEGQFSRPPSSFQGWDQYTGSNSASESEVSTSSHKKIDLTERYFLIELESQKYLCDKGKVISLFWRQFLSQAPKDRPGQMTPVLIATPTSVEFKDIEHNLSFLTKLGFDVGRVGKGNVVLRAYPSFLDVINHHRSLEFFIKSCAKCKRIETEEDEIAWVEKFLGSILNDNFNLEEFQFMGILKYLKKETLLLAGAIVEVNDELLNPLFKK